ncbi:DUF3955 domain-containing protein [Lapidilactobacillus gannanensis]|uniref:DUF3955 domain-containing protein n=1 Tax=Lapidilactobacillus gannanensis TaxID=2486002 RepID=A0ABW4BMX2_9LACO|nr:DUF3955 domain-containing protein [Lapidilactobacillus gannanensis]
MKKFWGPIGLYLVAILLPWWGTSWTYVDQQGVVHEPGFYTIPVAELLFVGATIWLGIVLWRRHRQHLKQ